MIYAVPDWNSWLYVGKTEQTLTARLETHLRDPDRATRWHTVMAILLDPEVSMVRLGQMERSGRELLAPRTGSRWSTGAA
jgi:Uri superfamily endonuclease